MESPFLDDELGRFFISLEKRKKKMARNEVVATATMTV